MSTVVVSAFVVLALVWTVTGQFEPSRSFFKILLSGQQPFLDIAQTLTVDVGTFVAV